MLQQRECAAVLGSCSDLVGSAVSVGTWWFWGEGGWGGDVRTDTQGFDLVVCGYFLAVLQCLYLTILYSNHFRNLNSGLGVYFAVLWQFGIILGCPCWVQ